MALKRFFLFGLASMLILSANTLSAQTKNRIAISDVDKIILYEYNSATKTFDIVWESAATGIDGKSSLLGIRDIALRDIDNDEKNELVAFDQFGIFIWGKNGKFPIYYNLMNASSHAFAYILPMDLDKDGTFEFLTQRSWDYSKRKIEAWKIQNSEAVHLSEIELPGGSSWSLRSGDCDNDKTEDILTSSNLIQVLGWDKCKGFFEKASFPNLSSLVDVVKAADIDGDGQNEIVASGNGGCFTVYKARKLRESANFVYPVLYQSEDLGGYTQGLEIADIDGDKKNEILVGATLPSSNKENVFVFERSGGISTPAITKLSLRLAFSMAHESSSIPGFVVGDADNDGRNEVIYNSRHVLKFSRDAEGRLQCATLATLGDKRAAAAIGPFEPEGKDEPKAQRIIPRNLVIDLKEGDIIESGKTYRIWALLSSPWTDARNVRVRLASLDDDIRILQEEALVGEIGSGKTVDTKAAAFLVKPDGIMKEHTFELKLELTADGAYRLQQTYHIIRNAQGGNVILNAVPKFEVKSGTLGISTDEDIYKDLGLSYDYFNDDYGTAWPPIEAMVKYENFFIQADFFISNGTQRDKMQKILSSGKNLLFHGNKVIALPKAEANRVKPFYDLAVNYFKSRYVKGYEGEKAVKGKEGDLLSNGLAFALVNRERESVPKEFRTLPNVLEALPGAEPFFFYPTGEVAAVRVHDKYKLVYLGFSLDDIQPPEVKKELVRRIMAWFDAK